jgi:hypothetical protein
MWSDGCSVLQAQFFTNYGSVATPVIRDLLLSLESELFVFDQSRKKKKSYDKTKARAKIDFKVQLCRNMAELTAQLSLLSGAALTGRTDSSSSNSSNVYNRGTSDANSAGAGRAVTVLVMEDLANSSVIVPARPQLPEIVEEDDDAPIDFIGLDEYYSYRADKWASADHRVNVNVAGVVGNSSGASTTLRSNSNFVSCLTDSLTALNEALSTYSSKLAWVEGATNSLCQPESSVLYRADVCSHVRDVCVSERIQQTLFWCRVMQSVPEARTHFQTATASASDASGSLSNSALFSKCFTHLFPRSASAAAVSQPRLVVCLGGTATADKFRVLDEVLDMVRFKSSMLVYMTVVTMCVFIK